jgi:hypothetical protein
MAKLVTNQVPCDLTYVQQMSDVLELLKSVHAETTPQELNRLDAVAADITLRNLDAGSNKKRLGDAIILDAYLAGKEGIRLKEEHPLMYAKLESYGQLLSEAARLRGFDCIEPFLKDHGEIGLILISKINESGDKGASLEELAQATGRQLRDVHLMVDDLDTIGLVAPVYDEKQQRCRARISEIGRKYVAERPIVKLQDILKSEYNK